MFGLRLPVFCLFICGTYGFTNRFFNFMNNCNPPDTVLGKICAALIFNDHDGNGIVNDSDFHYDSLTFNWDEDVCNMEEWEAVKTMGCRFGYSADYARWVYPSWDSNRDGIVNEQDIFSSPRGSFNFTVFINFLYNRQKRYCAQPEPRTDPIDIEQCREINALRPEDVKCD